MSHQFGFWNFDAENHRLIHSHSGCEIRFQGECQPPRPDDEDAGASASWRLLEYVDKKGITPVLIRRTVELPIFRNMPAIGEKKLVPCLLVDYVRSAEHETAAQDHMRLDGLRWLQLDRNLVDALCSAGILWFQEHLQIRLKGGWVNGEWQDNYHRVIWDYQFPPDKLPKNGTDSAPLEFDDKLLDKWIFHPKVSELGSKFANYDFGLYPLLKSRNYGQLLQIRRHGAAPNLSGWLNQIGTGMHYYSKLFYECQEYMTLPIYIRKRFTGELPDPPIWRFTPCFGKDAVAEARALKMRPDDLLAEFYSDVTPDEIREKLEDEAVFEPRRQHWSDFEVLLSSALLYHGTKSEAGEFDGPAIGDAGCIVFENYNYVGSAISGSRAYALNTEIFRRLQSTR